MDLNKTTNDYDPFPAHIHDGTIQSCFEHNQNTAFYACEALTDIGLARTAYLAGLLHDCGKYSNEFREYITASANGEAVRKGSVIHSFAGVSFLLSRFHLADNSDPYELITAELIAYAIGAHHGLFDCVNENKVNGFIHRIMWQPDYDQTAIANYLTYCQSADDLCESFHCAADEIKSVYENIVELVKDSGDQQTNECLFYLGLTARLISSAVINGDRRDTAEFMSGADYSSFPAANKRIWDQCQKSLEQKIDSFPCDTEIQRARQEISGMCLRFADQPGGIYRLNIPTGGGKTLSSLRYALAHASKYGKRKIIYTAPLISILDQNSAVIKDAVGDSNLVLEHHSNIIHDRENEDLSQYDLLTETWDAPIIITTLVQLLNTLFAGKSSSVRRFHSLCNSVLIIDEVQSVPTNMLTLFNLAVNFLNKIMGVTVILCSATQPCQEELPHRLHVSDSLMISKEKYDEYKRIFRRTEIIYRGSLGIDDVPALAGEILQNTDSLLVICNTKKEASDCYQILKGIFVNCYHLSAAMCMAHRKEILNHIYASLKSGQKTVCVSTQVIEAGVDISFGAVIRFVSGIDNIVQAAGRCNRNGENNAPGRVFVIRFLGEKLGKLSEIKTAQDATNELLFCYSADPGYFDNDLSSDKAVEYFYKKLYSHFLSEQGGHFDFPVKNGSLFKLLSDNASYTAGSEGIEQYTLRQAFKTAGDLFEVFDQDAESVIVPYGKGRSIIAELLSEKAGCDIGYVKQLLEKSKEYSVSVYRWQMEKLLKEGAIWSVCDGNVFILDETYYEAHTGLLIEPTSEEENEWNIPIL